MTCEYPHWGGGGGGGGGGRGRVRVEGCQGVARRVNTPPGGGVAGAWFIGGVSRCCVTGEYPHPWRGGGVEGAWFIGGVSRHVRGVRGRINWEVCHVACVGSENVSSGRCVLSCAWFQRTYQVGGVSCHVRCFRERLNWACHVMCAVSKNVSIGCVASCALFPRTSHALRCPARLCVCSRARVRARSVCGFASRVRVAGCALRGVVRVACVRVGVCACVRVRVRGVALRGCMCVAWLRA